MRFKYDSPFKYFVGVRSLSQIAAREDRVVVMNILGNESRKVTPVSHVFSGGNVVAGVQYGRPGVMETKIGGIPVYSRLAEVVEAHEFNTGVIYLPPAAVYYAVSEMCHYNDKLEKLVIVTEKLSVKDQRLIRAIAQINRVDVFGANSLGVADAWNHVRIGGGLGGDRPEELLMRGSVALHSNSGNFSTTITEYLKTEGFGVTTVVSSGKDKIIQFAVAEFLYAAENDPRTKAVVLYVEPGGYYEKQALDWIREGRFKFSKPIIALVTGRWKAKLTRAVGHAGALAGSHDDARAKEKWFDQYFGRGPFDPSRPDRVSPKGIRVKSIQDIPLAVKAVYEKNGWAPDFEKMGDLRLKPWFANDQKLKLPAKLAIPVVEALHPYNEEIAALNKQLGATYLRQRMRNASGASAMNPKTQLGELHGIPVTELAQKDYEENIFFALARQHPTRREKATFNFILNYLAATTPAERKLVRTAERNGATPNEALMAPIALMGDNVALQPVKDYLSAFADIFVELNLRDTSKTVHWETHKDLLSRFFSNVRKTKKKAKLPAFLEAKLIKPASNIRRLAVYLLEFAPVGDGAQLVLAALLFELFFPHLIDKRMTRDSFEHLPDYLAVIAKLVSLAAVRPEKNAFLAKLNKPEAHPGVLHTSFSETAYRALFNAKPTASGLREFNTLLGVTVTNGPGTISAKGAKESVSARNHISTAFIGYLANTGLAHGGNGFEGIRFLMDSFAGQKLKSPEHYDKALVRRVAAQAVRDYLQYKKEAKAQGKSYRRIPGINHPVFKGKPVNIDPREARIYAQFKKKGLRNVFWDFYKVFVEELFKQKGSKNVYCVNIDGVIAAISFKLLWKLYRSKAIDLADMQKIGFNLFLFGRTAGIAAEIADHRARGLDMDTRTPASEIRFVI